MKPTKIFPLICLLLGLLTLGITLADKEYMSFISSQSPSSNGMHIIYIVLGLPILLIVSSVLQFKCKTDGRGAFYAYASFIALFLFFDLLFAKFTSGVQLFNSRPMFTTHIIFASVGTLYLRFYSWLHPDPPEIEDGKSLTITDITDDGLIAQEGTLTPWQDISLVGKYVNTIQNYSTLGYLGVFAHIAFCYYIKLRNSDDKIKLSNFKLIETISLPRWQNSSQANPALEIKRLIETAMKHPHIKFEETSNMYDGIKPLNLQLELKNLKKL